jgi:hypothetical protein
VTATVVGASPVGLPEGCSVSAQQVQCTITSLAPGRSTMLAFEVVGTAARLASTSVRFSFPEFGRDTVSDNNTASASYTIFDPDE